MTIAVVGIGLGGVEDLPLSVKKIVEQATVLAGSKRHLSYVANLKAKKIYFTDLQQGIDGIASLDLKRHSVVILTSGDPLFFGLGRLLLANFNPEQIEFYPYVSSVQLAFSKIKIPWQDANLVSVHGRNTEELIKLLKQGKDKIALLTDTSNNPAAIASIYLALDLPLDYTFYICENLGATDEEIKQFDSNSLIELSKLGKDDFSSLNVLVLIRQPQSEFLDIDHLPILGLPDCTFLSFRDRPSLITKKEIRTAILCELALQPNQTIWDIGAGTGSVSIEIARLCPSSRIFAIEKTSMGSTLIEQNSKRFQVNNVTSINGKAPKVLLDLPQPNRIFIGGSGGNLLDILDFCQQQLLPAGIIVMAFATIEHRYQTITWLNDNSWQYRLLQLQVSRSTPVNHLTRFTPLNPVTIITAFYNNQ